MLIKGMEMLSMFWVVIFVIFALIAASTETIPGKIIFGSAVLSIGFLLLRWITGIVLFTTLAKYCAILIVVAIVLALLIAIIA